MTPKLMKETRCVKCLGKAIVTAEGECVQQLDGQRRCHARGRLRGTEEASKELSTDAL